MPILVKGQIELPQDTASFTGATVFIAIESVGVLDMPATIVTETIQHNVTYEGDPLNFSVEGDTGEAEAPFNLRVHISHHHSDDVKKGDFLTKRGYSVLKGRAPDEITVQVELV